MVKFAVSLLIAASIAAPALARVPSRRLEIRDVAAQYLDGRSAVDVIKDIFTREEINEVFGRDVGQLDARDLEELYEREIDANDEMSARDLQYLDTRFLHGLIENFKNTFHIGDRFAIPSGDVVRRDTANDEMSARDLQYLDSRLLNGIAKLGAMAGAASAARKNFVPSAGVPLVAPSVTPPLAGGEVYRRASYASNLSGRELLEEPIERSYEDEFNELLSRYMEDGELYARSHDDTDLFERDYDEDMFARDFEVDELD